MSLRQRKILILQSKTASHNSQGLKFEREDVSIRDLNKRGLNSQFYGMPRAFGTFTHVKEVSQ